MNTDGVSPAGQAARGEPEHESLNASEARFRAVITSNADGMIVVAEDGIILFANPAAEKLLGRSRETLVGTDFGRPIIPGETIEIDVFRAGCEPRIAEMRVVQTVWNDRPAALASFRDVTDRKRLEDELNRRVAELAEADQQKNTFLAMLAHELRNPLAPVRNATEILRLKPHDMRTLIWARTMIEQQVEHMTRLVDDLMDVSRITRGKIQLRLKPIRLSEAIANSVAATRSSLDQRGLRLEVVCQDEEIVLSADATRLEQIFANLLNNAAKFSDDAGLIQIHVSRQGDKARIVVQDHGIGIPSEMLSRVFDLFAQADATIDRSRGGLGIGLTLVRSLVELHGACVHAESDGPGRGSRFVLEFPTIDAHTLEPESPKYDPFVPAKRLRVLIVDDNLYAAESLGMLVKLWGHESHQAYDGGEALQAAETYRPEVVLLDIGLPVLDGYEVARNLRQSQSHAQTLIVAMTGYGQEADRMRTREAGFDHHMVKPVDLDELRNLLMTNHIITEFPPEADENRPLPAGGLMPAGPSVS